MNSAKDIGLPEALERAAAALPGDADGIRPVNGDPFALLSLLDTEASQRFRGDQRFRELSAEQRRDICEDIRHVPDAAPGFEAAARFFAKVRDLTAAAFWTTEEGMRDLEYIGNVPLDRWDPPPPAVLRHLGLD